jgi:hypothetical protein
VVLLASSLAAIAPLIACGESSARDAEEGGVEAEAGTNKRHDAGPDESEIADAGSDANADRDAGPPYCGDVTGTPTVIGPKEYSATALVAEPGATYWCEYGPVKWEAPSTVTMLADIDSCHTIVHVDATHVWFTDAQNVARVRKNGGGYEVLYSRWDTGADPRASWFTFAVDATTIYWTDYYAGAIFRGAKSGAGMTKIADAPWATDIAVDDDAVYFSDENGLHKLLKATGETVTFDTGVLPQLGPGWETMTLANGWLYWISAKSPTQLYGPGSVMRTSTIDGKTEELFSTSYDDDAGSFYGVSVQAGCLYFGQGDNLLRTPLDAVERHVVASGHLGISWYAATSSRLFWSDWEGSDPGKVYVLDVTH